MHRNRPALRRVSNATSTVLAGALVLVDALIWATDPVIDTGRLSISLAVLVPALGVIGVGSVAWRLRGPGTALVVLAAASIGLTTVSLAVGTSLPPSFASVFALGLLTATVLRGESGRRALALAALAGVAVAGEALRPQVAGAGYLLAVGTAGFAVAVGIGVYLRWTDWYRAAAARTARDAERIEIAQELHDLVGHHLTGIVVQANAARHVAERRPEAATEALEHIGREGTEALAALRWVVGALRDEQPLGSSWLDIERLATFAAAPGLEITTAVADDVPPLSEAHAPVVYRVVAEALTNARRHGQGVTRIQVVATVEDEHLVVAVHDDGAPAPEPTGGSGIDGLRTRVEDLGGQLTAGPGTDGGWTVRATLPLEATP